MIDDDDDLNIWLTLGSLFGSNGEELGDDFERHPFGFRDFKVDEEPGNGADDCVNWEDASKAYRVKHDWERVGDDDVSNPKCEGADCDAESTHPSREYFGAEDVRDRAEPHDERAEVDDYAHGWDDGMHHRPQIEYVSEY